jgi:site-specific recombinase XerD
MSSQTFAALLQGYFTDRLYRERRASPHTIAGYRDTFRLLLRFASERLHTAPDKLKLENLDSTLIGSFLDHLERKRRCTARTRNARLGAIRSFFRYVTMNEPSHALLCQRVLALPNKRHERKTIAFLTRPEMDALVAAPDRSTWAGRRDSALLLLALQTGLRLSEITSLHCQDVHLESGPHVRCDGKGRKERCTPLRPDAVRMLSAWLRERMGRPEDPLFPSIRGGRLSSDAVQLLVSNHAAAARKRCPSLERKRVTPHVLRHSAAMDLLHHGVDRTVLALWLGHESVETTQVHADMSLKERALAHTSPLNAKPRRYKPSDALISFLESL